MEAQNAQLSGRCVHHPIQQARRKPPCQPDEDVDNYFGAAGQEPYHDHYVRAGRPSS